MEDSYIIEEYITESGDSPFADLLLNLKDPIAKAKIRARLLHVASSGNFGDWKRLKGAEKLYEMREHFGPGYRLFYTIQGQTVVLLLIGSSKKDQQKAIQKAKKYLNNYTRRTHDKS